MRRLWIHIGHDKTGSSYLQALFARNLERLSEQGIGYPIRKELMQAAVSGLATSGTEQDAKLEARMAELPADQDVLLSSESIFNALMDRPEKELKRWAAWKETFGFDEINVLLFTRNPVSHAISTYMQIVRAHGATMSMDDFVLHYRRPFHVMQVLKRLDKVAGVKVTVKNYSTVRDKLLAVVLDWLELTGKVTFVERKDEIVNRGLTEAEIVVTRKVNAESPDLGRRLALQSLYSYPELKSAKVAPGYGVQDHMIKANKDAMGMVNRRVGEDQEGRYNIDVHEPKPIDVSPEEEKNTEARMRRALRNAQTKKKVRRILKL